MSSSLVTSGPVIHAPAAENVHDVCALSPLQQEIFSDPNHAAFTEQSLWNSNWPLDRENLQCAWELLARRHAILRTVFRQARKQPVQVIRPSAQLSLTIHDIQHEKKAIQQESIRQISDQQRGIGFDLAQGAPFRVDVFRLTNSRFTTLLTFHPILLDRQSVAILQREFSALYVALQRANVPAETDAPTIKDFIVWLKRQDSAEASKFWQQSLEGAVATFFKLEPPDLAEGSTFAQRDISFSADLASAVKKLAASCDVSVSTVLQAAWAILLSRYLDASDVVFGLELDGRPEGLAASQDMAGRFAHTVPVRVRLQPDETVTQLLDSLRTQLKDIKQHSHFPLSTMIGPSKGMLLPEKLFNTSLREAVEQATHKTANLRFLSTNKEAHCAQGLAIEICQKPTLKIAITFPEQVFQPALVESVLASLRQLVESMAAAPDDAVAELEMLSSQERMRVLAFGRGDVVNDETLWQHVGIARPGPGARVYVLERQRLSPPGCVGEIGVSGISEADAKACDKRLIPDPATPGRPETVYVTARKGCWRPDGLVHILPEGGSDATTELGPLPSGYIAPVTETEKLVAKVWQEVLGVAQVGLHDDFFDLGGHSLNTIQIRSRLSQRLGIKVPLKAIFANPGLQAQAKAIAALRSESTNDGLGIPRLPDRKHYPVSHAQRRLWFLHRLDPDDRFYHTADYISLEGPLNRQAFEQAFRDLVKRQAILRTSFKAVGDEPVQCITEEPLDLSFHDISGLAPEEQTRTMKQFQDDIPKWLSNLELPPVGALLFKLSQEKHVFILAIHHILSDEWSGQVVWRDLMELYAAACRNRTPQLPEIRARYVDFAVWQKTRIDSGQLAESERYWMQRLGGNLPELNLPVETAQTGKKATDLLSELVESGPELGGQFARIAQELDVTPFMLRLAIFKAFLARITGQCDILLGTTTAGRDHPEIEPLVGLFVNVVALRTNLDGNPSFPEVVKRVKQTCVEAYAHQEYPFDLLVQRLAPARAAGHLPLLQAFFADIPLAGPKDVEGLRFTPVDVSNGMAAGMGGRKLPVGLGLVCHDAGGGALHWRFLFRGDVFAPETGNRLARQFRSFLSNLASDLDARLADIPTVCMDAKELPLVHLPDRNECPLSFNQRDMWFQRQIHSGAGLNNLGARVTLAGPLNVELFRQALQAVVDRHETLRTVFGERDGLPYQHVLDSAPVAFPICDISSKSQHEQEETLTKRQYELVAEPYDFSRGPLFRAELTRLQDNKHVFLFAFSHLILDGVYMAELFEQVAESYELLLNGKPGALPSLDFQYRDFAAWQDERLKRGLLEKYQSYWQEQLRAPLPAMGLPTDKETHLVHNFELGYTQWQVQDDVFRALKSFRKRYRTTIFRTVLAAFEVLLRKMIGEKELLLGVPFSSLPAHASHTLGFFGHAVPARITLDDDQPFTQLLADVNRMIGRAQENLEYPLCEAVRGMRINRDPHRPLFPVVVSQVKDLHRTVGDLRMTMDARPVHAGVYHLWLTVLESSQGIQLCFYYNREAIEGRPLAMIQECFNELLAQVAAQPEARIGDLGIVSSAEREKVLTQLAGTAGSTAHREAEMIERFEDHARKRPHAPAVICEGVELNYQQLNENANRLAHWLRAQGIGPESRVGIFGARSTEMLTTMLGVLKAGAAFVPLDPEYPDGRLKGILNKANLRVLATSAKLVGRSLELSAAAGSAPSVICWHNLPAGSGVPDPCAWAGQPGTNPRVKTGLRDLAYVCHTSGSTGIPKGAMIERQGMLNHLLAKIDLLGLDKDSVVAQNASHCFDISVWQSFAALLAGGRVVIYLPESLAHPGSMLKLVEQDKITVLETVPSLLEMMLNEVPADVTLPALRHLISNAELLPVPLCRRWRKRFPHVLLVNTYGATECSDDTTHQIVRDTGQNVIRIPVGLSIAGARHYVLDQDLQVLPAGCAGQIAIAGDVVGRGYLADPSTTARAFVPDPFREDGHRMYLTGDIGRWNSAGELEFLERRDNQVKIHGHRVELTEIEAALSKVAGVRQVAAVVVEDQGSPRLLAYWVADEGVDGNMLRNHARKELPAYMVPNAFIQLPALPLTPNGKVDRQALPKPTDPNGGDFVPPRDELEFKLAELWRKELGISSVGVFDNFFERGGHSLKAVSLINRLQKEFRVSLPLRTLFDHQTIDSLSRVIRDRCTSETACSSPNGRLIVLQPGKEPSLPLFLVHPHGGTVFCYQSLASALGDQIPVIGIQCRGLEEGERPLSSIPEMAAEYIKDILHRQPEGPYQIAGWSLGGPIAFEIARQLEAGDRKVAFLGIFDSALPCSTGKQVEELLPESISTADFGSQMSMTAFARWFFRADERQFEGLSDAQVVDTLKEMAQRAGMLPPDVSPDMLKRFIGVAISSGIALYQYKPEGPVQTDVALFRAAQSLVEDPGWWTPWTRGSVQVVQVEGSHYDMVFPPAVQSMAAALKDRLLARQSPAERDR